MILRTFTVFDAKANAYLPPFCFGHIGEALRAFIDAAQDPNHKFHKHGHDFSLFHLGHFDDNTGTFDLFEQPNLIGRADIVRADHERKIAAQKPTVHPDNEILDNSDTREGAARFETLQSDLHDLKKEA